MWQYWRVRLVPQTQFFGRISVHGTAQAAQAAQAAHAATQAAKRREMYGDIEEVREKSESAPPVQLRTLLLGI